MPFIERHIDFQEGAFGSISKYDIHKDHLPGSLSLEKKEHRWVAVKEIKGFDRENAQAVARHWVSEVRALSKMNELNQDHIVRFFTAFRRQSSKSAEHYMIFEWADGGNLRELWRSIPSPTLTTALLKDVIKQLLGLATALASMHNPDHTGTVYRHGDLKPENILRFTDDGVIGTLKIGDWGKAKAHNIVTELCNIDTEAMYGTRRYEAPEIETGIIVRRSRLSDIWAMGCVTLEFMIWLLYGLDGLEQFSRSVSQDPMGRSAFYQNTPSGNGEKKA